MEREKQHRRCSHAGAGKGERKILIPPRCGGMQIGRSASETHYQKPAIKIAG